MPVRCSAVLILLFSLLSAQTSKIPSRFSVIESNGVFLVVRSAAGKYASFDEIPANIRNEFIAATESQKSSKTNSAKTTSVMTTFVVSDASDAADFDINDGVYSPPTLRSAIENANKLGGSHAISFSGITLIQPISALPTVNVALSIDGTVGFDKVTLDGSGTSASIGLMLTKTSTVKNMIFKSWKSLGLAINSGGINSVIQKCEFTLNNTGLNINAAGVQVGGENPDDRNFAYANKQDGIAVVFADNNIIQNNFSGTKDGMTASPNTYTGAYILGAKAKIKNNLFSGNSDAGLEIGEFSSGTLVEGNIIGLDSLGRGRVPNMAEGVLTFADNDSIINNVISGNSYGITVLGQASQTLIRGNIIGSNKTLDSLFGNRFGGLQILGPGVVIDSNIISCNLGSGMLITGNGGAVIKRNKIGTDPTGTLDWGNTGAGVNIVCDKNTVGGPSLSDRNIISGNGGNGIEMFGGTTLSFPGPSLPNYVQGNLIQNNIIGTDINGTTKIPNRNGMMMQGYIDSNFVRDNLISGNQQHGILFRSFGGSATRNIFTNNAIGTTITRDGALANDSSGIMSDGIGQNTFGGETAGDANTVAYNQFGGIVMRAGSGFSIKRNTIHNNKGLGIDLGNDGPTPNDSVDADTGPNLKQNFPRILWIGRNGSNTKVKGYLQSQPSTTFHLEFYTNDEVDTTGFGEGQTFQKTMDVTTNDSGRAPFEIIIDGTFSRVVATATHPQNGTSEFSKAPFIVNSVADRPDANPNDGLASTSGPHVNGIPEVTLRSALQASNHIIGEDDIGFDIPGAPPHFINPGSSLPVVLNDVTIDGSTQPGYDPTSVQAIRLLGGSAGANSDGFNFVGDRTTVRALYISQFQGNGIEMTGELLTLIDVTSNTNKKSGVHSSGDITLEGESMFNGNGPAALTSQQCNTHTTAGIWLSGWLRGKGKVTASSNCGPGIRHTESSDFSSSEIDLEASVTANGNSTAGILGTENIRLKGENFDFSNNGSPKIPASGIFLGGGDLSIEATGGGESPVIKANSNSDVGLYTGSGSVTLKGKAQVNNNGHGRTPLECFNHEIDGIKSEGTFRAQSLEVIGNGFDGIRTHGSCIIEGNVTVKDHPGRGIWATHNISLDGDEHIVDSNGDQAMWAANGWLKVKGKLKARNNKINGTHGVDDAPKETDSRVGSIQAWRDIILEDVEVENNEPTGIAGWDNVWIDGTAIVKNNSVGGIFAMDQLSIKGSNNLIINNGGDGLATNNQGIFVHGSITIDGNGKDASIIDEDNSGFGAIAQFIQMQDIIVQGNARTGLHGHRGVTIRGRGIINGNGNHGLASSVFVQISGGRVHNNEGYGIASPVVRMSGTQVGNNGLGGISGKNAGAPTLALKNNFMMNASTLPPFKSNIRGSSITGNSGDGISVDTEFPFAIEGSNISNNTGFGIKNEGTGQVDADGNWWGNASGPGASINGVVQASSWQSSSVGLYVGLTEDSIFVLPGDIDSLSIVAANWSNPNDSVSIDAVDNDGWLQPVNGRTIALHDSTPGVTTLHYSIPGNAVVGDTSTIIITGKSLISPATITKDTVCFVVYSPSLFQVLILKDTLLARAGDTLHIIAVGFDQKGKEKQFTPLWSASGGSITNSGLYVAGNDTGLFVVLAVDSLSGKKDSAAIRILAPSKPGAPAVIAVSATTIDAGDIKPGTQSFPQVTITNSAVTILSVDSVKTLTKYFTAVRSPDVNLIRQGDTLTIIITFSPDSNATYHDTLFIYYNSPLSPKKIVLSGKGITTGIETVENIIPTEYSLQQNYPNPFNPTTTIQFGLPVSGFTSLKVYDILGREIATIVDEVKETGFYSIQFDGSKLSTGVYIYTLHAGNFVSTKKLLLLK